MGLERASSYEAATKAYGELFVPDLVRSFGEGRIRFQ